MIAGHGLTKSNWEASSRMKRLVRLALLSVVVTIGAYVVYRSMGDVSDISIIVRDGLKADSRLPIEELAKKLGKENWSSACIVLPYAKADIATNAPAVLRDLPWVGNWNESEWRLVLMDADKVSFVATINFEAVRLVEQDPSGIACFVRAQRPLLKRLEHRAGYEFTME
jgi:hypothetical protein